MVQTICKRIEVPNSHGTTLISDVRFTIQLACFSIPQQQFRAESLNSIRSNEISTIDS